MNSDAYVTRALLVAELAEARSHLEELINRLGEPMQTIDSTENAVLIAHIYAHLNRSWNARAVALPLTDDQWQRYSVFPSDVTPLA